MISYEYFDLIFSLAPKFSHQWAVEATMRTLKRTISSTKSGKKLKVILDQIYRPERVLSHPDQESNLWPRRDISDLKIGESEHRRRTETTNPGRMVKLGLTWPEIANREIFCPKKRTITWLPKLKITNSANSIEIF